MGRKNFEEWEKDFIYLAYPQFSNPDIGKILGRSAGTVSYLATELKLKKQKIQIGDKFNKWTVLKSIHNGVQKWKCVCECGNESIIGTGTLTTGISKSCGCERLKTIRNGVGEITGTFFNRVKQNALDRNLEFTLTKELLNNLWLQQNKKCRFTGIELKISQINKNFSIETTASVDRIDSAKGYTIDNVQFIHKQINFMKQQLSDKKFIEWCRLITKYTNKEE